MTDPELHRRDVLRAIGAGSVVGVAGCTGSNEETTDEGDEDESDSTTAAAEEDSDTEELVENDDVKEEEEGEPTHTLEFTILSPDRSPKPDAKISGQADSPSSEFETPRTDENGRTQVELPEKTYHTFNLRVCSTESSYSCNLEQGEFLNVFPSEVVTDDGEGIHLTQDTKATIRELEQPTQISP